MNRLCVLVLLSCPLAFASDPVRTAWIMSPPSSAGVSRSLPEVRSVQAGGRYVVVRSAGVSLRYLGPLQPAPIPAAGPREFEFRVPIRPEPETGRHARIPVDVAGVFVNGLPIYNHFHSLSWNGSNLWHYDDVAYNDNGVLTAAGRPRPELTHPSPAGLLEDLILSSARHSPLIGFALDGYPVYGPWAYAHADGSGGLGRMRSGYRVRSIVHREVWPDGTRLMPAQYGPDVSTSDPLGTFAEDYEYVPGSGDLDEYNGRFAVTPEYPNGTYAYFLTTDSAGRLAYPYLIGPRFYGKVPQASGGRWYELASGRIRLSADKPRIASGHVVRFRLEAKKDPRMETSDSIRDFEYVHEKPIHFLVASADLAEFDHIHPELAADDSFEVAHTFAHGGKYRIWADYSLPGEEPRVNEFDVEVAGPARPSERLVPSSSFTQTAGPLTVTLAPSRPLIAGQDIPVTLQLQGSTDALEPYLGAWAHVIVVAGDFRSFAHVHPAESVPGASPMHSHSAAGPPPDQIHVITSFPSAGLYKLWAQFQNAGRVLTVPFVLRVEAGAAQAPKLLSIPPDAIRIRVTQHGFEPARIEIPAGTVVNLAFKRDSTPNCGAEVVFPSLGIRKALPLGETVLLQLPPQAAGEIGFACGMGMNRGMIVASPTHPPGE